MPIPSSITDLQATESLNFPQGGDQVGGNIDNFLRAHAAIIKRQFSKGADINSAATLVLPADGSYFNVVKVVSAITNINDNFNGRTVCLKFEVGITLTHSTSLILPLAADIVTEAGDVAVMVNEAAGVWRCTFYSSREATEARKGIARIATQTQVDAGTDDATMVTPKKLRWGFVSSLGNSGYIIFPSWLGGFCIQWGEAASSAIGFATCAFPIPFPSACYKAVASTYAGGGAPNTSCVQSGPPTATRALFATLNGGVQTSTPGQVVVTFIAVGK